MKSLLEIFKVKPMYDMHKEPLYLGDSFRVETMPQNGIYKIIELDDDYMKFTYQDGLNTSTVYDRAEAEHAARLYWVKL